ncbi:MAG: hypothetical protein JO166_09125 [Deltaproteobacteria bacterium]|nr:hypothetical protein [Deltaproteobacteria bacterium]
MRAGFERDYKHYRQREGDEFRSQRPAYIREPRERPSYEFHPMIHAVKGLCDLVEDSTRIGLGLLDCLGELRRPFWRPFPVRDCRFEDEPRRWLQTHSCECDIPAPCWMPRELQQAESWVCPGGTATLRFRITNSGPTKREFKIEAEGGKAVPDTLTLESWERGYSVVSVTMPADADWGQRREVLVWVRGCHDHVLRWTIKVSHEERACEEIVIDDRPDPIHHWYDHYYCERRCCR